MLIYTRFLRWYTIVEYLFGYRKVIYMKCVHLDFHTSLYIEEIGEKFDKAEFASTVKNAKVDLMTVFAKCHHGYTYYPTKVGIMHPHLKFNLLKEQLEALRSVGIKAPIYIPIGWSENDAVLHPEWHQLDFATGEKMFSGSDLEKTPPDEPIKDCSWTALCPVGEYGDYLEKLTREVCENFDVSDGVFYDLCFIGRSCGCPSCKAKMEEAGLDPTSLADAEKFYIDKRIEMMKRLTGVVHEYSKDAPVFYNGGADMNRAEYHHYQTHFELEDLPTAWGGYDLMPLRAKFFEKYGKRTMGMTGKFHHCWGEFGGFKSREALTYECMDMLSVGIDISVGDQLHPSGKIDKSTYSLIGYAFGQVESIENYCKNTKAYSDVGLYLSGNYTSDMGASKALQSMHLDFDVLGEGDKLDGYSLVILPDRVKLSGEEKRRILDFVGRGGSLVLSYDSAFPELGIEKIAPSEYDKDYIECDLSECTTPFLAYSSAYKVKSQGGEVLASVYEPYFSRTARHFCGHKNTPNKPEKADYPAALKLGNIIYFAHPVFEAYNNSGAHLIERYIEKGIDAVYNRYISLENLPNSARVRVREAADGSFLAMHLLYSPPVNRGIACMLTDFPTLFGVKVSMKMDKEVSEVVCEPDGERIDFVIRDGVLSFEVPQFSLHKLIVIK